MVLPVMKETDNPEEEMTMTEAVKLTATEVAKLVNGDDALKAALVAKWLESNPPSLTISDLPVEPEAQAEEAQAEEQKQ